MTKLDKDIEKYTCKDRDAITILREQIISCQKDITTYNSIFITSSVLSSILAAIASVIGAANSDGSFVWKFFYLLPTIYFLSLYNLTKYTTVQMELSAYKSNLEKRINEIFNDKILYCKLDIQQKSTSILWGGVIQVCFYLPIAVFMVWGFWKIEHDAMWKFMFIVTLLQIISVLAMLIRLMLIAIKQKKL